MCPKQTVLTEKLSAHVEVFIGGLGVWINIYTTGASVSEPLTSELNCNFSYIYYHLSYVVLYIFDAVI